MRHRQTRPVLDLLSSPTFLRRGALAASAVVALGTATGVVLTSSETGHGAAGAPTVVADAPSAVVTPTAVIGADRSQQPSRSARRTAQPLATRHPAAPAPHTSTPSPALPTVSTPTAGVRRAARSTAPAPSPSQPAPSKPSGDSTPPSTTARTLSLVGGVWTVAMGATEPVASLECSLDGGAWHPCSPTDTFTFTEGGEHTLAVRATDHAGNTDPTPVTVTVKVTGLGLGLN